jgi:hypothetical protein
MLALVIVVWLGVWRGWLSSEWGYWSLSTGTLVTTITLAVWHETPGNDLPDGA